jgi:hypothetical protein
MDTQHSGIVLLDDKFAVVNKEKPKPKGFHRPMPRDERLIVR